MGRARFITIVSSLAALAGPARAQDAPPEPDATRGVRLDLVRGPLITSSRIMGLGGAYVGVAEGIDGIWRNPAALSNRSVRSTSWFDGDVTFDWLFVSSADIDWDGDGQAIRGSPGGPDGATGGFEFQALNLGFVLQLGPLGLGLLATFYGWEGGGVSVAHADVLFGAGWAFADGEVIVGGGATISTLELTASAPEAAASAALTGAAGDFGVLWRPREEDFRVGLRLRTKARMTDPEAVLVDVGIVPWQLALGASWYHAGERGRRYNPALRATLGAPHDRRYLMIASDVVLTGTSGGVSLESLLGDGARPGDGEVPVARPSGRRLSLGLHLGAEGEVIHDRVKARVGTYFEPVRAAGAQSMRPHMTGGIEIHLFELLFDWKANLAFDLAPGWQNVTVGVGFWK